MVAAVQVEATIESAEELAMRDMLPMSFGASLDLPPLDAPPSRCRPYTECDCVCEVGHAPGAHGRNVRVWAWALPQARSRRRAV